jgi:Tfp pilus assembly protein PilO
MNNLLQCLLQANPSGDWLFASEKINTVLVVVLIVFLGMVSMLVYNLVKVKKLEQKVQELKKASPVNQTQSNNPS